MPNLVSTVGLLFQLIRMPLALRQPLSRTSTAIRLFARFATLDRLRSTITILIPRILLGAVGRE